MCVWLLVFFIVLYYTQRERHIPVMLCPVFLEVFTSYRFAWALLETPVIEMTRVPDTLRMHACVHVHVRTLSLYCTDTHYMCT